MKRGSLLLAVLFSVAPLFAGVAPYIGVGIGGVSAKDADFKYSDSGGTATGELESGGGALIEGAFGLDFDDIPFRFEGALTILANELDSVSYDGLPGVSFDLDDSAMAVSSFMVNGYFDIPTDAFIEPYVFGGLGRATIFHELNNEDTDDTVGAVQLGGGLGFVLTDYFIIDLKYRYFTTEDYTVSSGSERLEAEYASHQLIGGIRVRF